MLDHVTGGGVGDRLEVHVVGIGAVADTAHLEPQGEGGRIRLLGQHLEHGGPGLGGDGQYRADVDTVFAHACHHKGVSPSRRPVPADAHEWISFQDPDEERTWLFDVTFLTARWTCIFGQGLPGRPHRPGPRAGTGMLLLRRPLHRKEGRPNVERAAGRPDPRVWQFHKQGQKGVVKKLADGDLGTRLVDDACIFLNRPGFAAGAGLRPAQGGHGPGDQPRRAQARGLLAATAPPGGRDLADGTSPRRSTSGTAATGARAGRVPLVVHRGTRGLRRPRAGLREHADRTRGHGRQEGLPAARRVPRWAHRPRTPVTLLPHPVVRTR